MKTKVSTRGQVSIPAKIRKEFNIEPDSRIEWVVKDNIITLFPLPKDPVKAFRGKGKGCYTTNDLIRERRKERKEEDEAEKRRQYQKDPC
ncbi:MAG: AbrB/MazE/SpoVT family DNA-binding domain-containing protein [Nitrospirota bacterium]